jgi:tetratricopeptide (TPR) repeat protein
VTGLLLSFFLALAVLAALILVVRPPRGMAMLVCVALVLGLAGYAWQGRPALAGHPTPPTANRKGGDTLFAQERPEWLETVGPDAVQLDGADALIRNGDPDYAIGLLHASLTRAPNNMMLWLGLGNALQSYADGIVTPPALYAYGRAQAIAPRHPAPAYFLGLAYLQSGDADKADQIWRDLLRNTPPDAPWREQLRQRIEMLALFRARP